MLDCIHVTFNISKCYYFCILNRIDVVMLSLGYKFKSYSNHVIHSGIYRVYTSISTQTPVIEEFFPVIPFLAILFFFHDIAHLIK